MEYVSIHHTLLLILRNRNFAKLLTDKQLHVGRKIIPTTLKSRSAEAEEGRVAVNTLVGCVIV